MTRGISLLGSTGSIGRQTLEVCAEQGIPVMALTANRNIDLLERQTRQFRPRLAVLADMEAALAFARRVEDLDVKVAYGMEGLVEAAALPESDTVVTAVVGMVGLTPTLAAVERGKRVALANKETLVCGGDLVMAAARRRGAEILPVDSEHSAIFQCLQGCADRREIRRLESRGAAPTAELNAFLEERGTAPLHDGAPLIALLRRPELHYADLAPFDPSRPDLPPDVAEQVEISVKYAGYIQRQTQEVAELRRMEGRALPEDLDYAAIQGLRLEAREKLGAIRPLNLGQAARVSGVSPADVAALMIYLERERRNPS